MVKSLLNIVANCVDENYLLSEQVPINLNYPEKYNYCEIKWGKIAKSILWSHAMYIILYCLFTKGKDNVKNYGRI